MKERSTEIPIFIPNQIEPGARPVNIKIKHDGEELFVKKHKVVVHYLVMGNTASVQITANFEDIQNGITRKNGILIHIMDDESILISGTVKMTIEATKINELMTEHNYDINIIIYGRNVDDYEILSKKRTQLMSLGFRNVWFYPGGLFEWILLRDIFGTQQFLTTTEIKDILKYRPLSVSPL